MRISSRCVSVVVASRSAAFLSRFAAASLRDRLLVWETRLLLVTQLDPAVLQALFRDHWNFAMMNTAALNLEERHGERRLALPVYSEGTVLLALYVCCSLSDTVSNDYIVLRFNLFFLYDFTFIHSIFIANIAS